MFSGTTATVPADASPPKTKKVRLPLQSIQGLVATGSLRLSSKEIQLFRQRGILRSETASRALEAISETAVASPQSPPTADARVLSHAASSPDQASRSPSAPAATSGGPSPSPSSSTASVVNTTPTPSPRPSHLELASGRRSSVHTTHRTAARTKDLISIPEAIASTKQSLPTYHHDVIEDTCSHLRSTSEDPQPSTALTPSMDISTSFRRHSESFAAARSRLPARSASIAIAGPSYRRDSTASPTTVPTPQGLRTVLYAASPAHTLYSLPTAAVDNILPNPAQSHTNAMGAFKFPSSPTTPPRRSTEPSSPSPPPYLPAGFRGTSPANTPGRSKRKGLPMRSPSMSDSQDQSPGVIFQLPFGAQGTRRFSSAADHSGRHSGITPPPVYPSPATSSTQSAASFQAGADASGPEHPPLEPVFTRGLGIHLQGQFTEERVPHPFDTETANQKASAVELPREAINDQCMPTPQSDSPRVSFKDAPAVAKTEDPSHSRPLQPATPIAAFSGGEISSADGGATTAETNTVYGSKPEVPEKANGPSMGDIETMSAQTKPEWTSQQPEQTPTVNQEQSLQVQDTAATSENTTSIPQNDSATMPLWAQRQLSIRRQSLIPRPELDFVRGSGILPAASKDLVLPEGGAIILTYPVLLSDVVKVAQDDAHDRSEGEQDSAEAAADSQHASAKIVKRRKTSQAGKRRESVSAASGALPQEKEAGLYNGAVHTGNARRLAKPAIVLPEAPGAFMAMVNGSTASQLSPAAPVSPQTRHSTRRLSTLGSPVEISTSSTFETSAHTRRGSKVAARRSSQQDLSSEGESDRSGSQQDSSEGMLGGDPNEQHAKGKAKKRELLPKAIAAGKIAFRKNSVHAAGPMHSPMDVDLDLNRSHSTSDLASSRAVQKRHLQEEYGEAMPSTPQQKKAKKGAGSQQNRAHQLATPQSDRHHAASPGLNEDFELASTLLHMHDGVIIDSPSRADSSHRLQLPVSKKPRTPKSLPPKPAKAVNGSPKKTPVAAPKPPRTPGPGQKHCEACGATETPCWRPGYTASTVLCNSCGLRYKKSNVYCTKLSCKYIPLKTEYAAMEAERVQNGWDHLRCQECGERVALPIPRNAA